jgi:hypothetical protein
VQPPPAIPTPRAAADDGLAGLLELFSTSQPMPTPGAPLSGHLGPWAQHLVRRAGAWGAGPEGNRRAW